MRQISGEIRVVHLQNYQLNSISRVRTQLILLVEIFGGPCRIRTHVSGSEGRKDIQTTLTVHDLSSPADPYSIRRMTEHHESR